MAKPVKPNEPKYIPPIYDEITQPTWWKYRKYTDDELNSITTLLEKRQKDLVLTSDLYENLKYLYKTIGLHHHPCLNTIPKANPPPTSRANAPSAADLGVTKEPPKDEKQSSPQKKDSKQPPKKDAKPAPEEEAKLEPPGPPFVVKNIKIDLALLRLLNFSWSRSKTNCIKMIKNEFEDYLEESLIQMISNPGFVLNQLFFDLNPPLNMQKFTNVLGNPNLEFISLRSCSIDDEKLGILCEALKQNSTLRFLDLFDNQIKEGIKYFVPLLKIDTCVLEYVGLARNNLKEWNVLKEWFNGIGVYPMTQEEVDKYREKEKERETNIQKNLKNKAKKGYVPEPVEYLDPIVQQEDGRWILVQGGKLKMINLGLNGFGDECVAEFDNFLARQAPSFRLILTGCPIGKQAMEKLQLSHGEKVMFY